ncbi:MAG: hypothetical protein ACI88C_001730 [Acidimicrobiales bacterium]|jgi:hypothetical protein
MRRLLRLSMGLLAPAAMRRRNPMDSDVEFSLDELLDTMSAFAVVSATGCKLPVDS